MGREGRDAHRDDGPLGGRQRSQRRKELIRTTPIHDTQDGVAALCQAQGTLPPVLWFLLTLDEPAPHEAVDKPAGGRWRPTDRFGQLADRERASVGQDIERGELREAEAQLPELTGKADHELAPEGTTHRHPLADLADVRESVPGREDRGGQVCLELPGDGPGRGGTGWRAVRVTVVGHDGKRTARA